MGSISRRDLVKYGLCGGAGVLLPACGASEPYRRRRAAGAGDATAQLALPRSMWTRAALEPSKANPMGSVRYITVHHEGSHVRTLTDLHETAELLERLRRYQVNQLGWADIGYHYVIDRTGRVWTARLPDWQGAHVRNNNPNNLGVMVLGNFEKQQPTEAQLAMLPSVIGQLRREHNVPRENVKTHREWVVTACPGRELQPRFDSMRNNRSF
ncbi:MAG: peptidoglycan recognition protein family protein [Planctomycetota bacterium]|jgi:hypothetical protein